MNVEETLAGYRGDHQNKINEALHLIGIPLIVSSLVILANSNSSAIIFQLIIGALMVFYTLLQDWRAILVAILMAAGFYLVNYLQFQSWQWGLGLFCGGWALQIPGHLIFEKNKPSVVSRSGWKAKLDQLIIAPIWWVETITLYRQWKKTP